MATTVFTKEEIATITEEKGFLCEFYPSGGMIRGAFEYEKKMGISNERNLVWEGDFEVVTNGERAYQLRCRGDIQLSEWLVSSLFYRPVKANILTSFQVCEGTTPEDFVPIAKAAGMRIVAESGYSPYSVNFIPDMSRAGEVVWVNAHDPSAVAAAMVTDPAEDPVVLRREDLRLVMLLADAYLSVGMYFPPEQKDAFDRVLQLLPGENR